MFFVLCFLQILFLLQGAVGGEERQRQRDRDREKSAIHFSTPQISAMAGAGWGQIQELETQYKALEWVAGTQPNPT